MRALKIAGETSEARLIGRSLVERWPMTQEARERAVARLRELAESQDGRTAVAAINAMVKADNVNLDQARLYHESQLTDDLPSVEIDGDADTIRLESELLARFASFGTGDAGRAGVGGDGETVEVPSSPDSAERGDSPGRD